MTRQLALRIAIPALAFLVPCAMAAQPAPSLDPAHAFTQYTHDVWQRASGLPQNSVMALAQTSDRYIWIATQDGLVRFDGLRFTVFNHRTTPALATSDIQTIFRDSQDRLWIGTAAGLAMLHQGRFSAFGSDQGLASGVVSAIHEDPDGAIWIGMGGGLARYASGRFERLEPQNGLPGHDISAIASDGRGVTWIGTHGGLVRLEGGRFTPYADTLPSPDVRAVRFSRDGALWIGTTGGLVRLAGGRTDTYTTANGLSSNFVREVLEDRAGSIWIATAEAGLNRIHGGRITHFTARSGLSDDDVRAVLEDEDGNLWIGTNAGGLNRLKNPRVLTFGKPEGLSHDVALAVIATTDGSLWVATYGGGLNRLKDGIWTAFTTEHGLASDLVLSLAAARDGSMWVGTGAGVDRLRGGRASHYSGGSGLADEPVFALLEDRQGGLWIGTRTGLKHLAGGTAKTYGRADGLRSSTITAIHEDRRGAIWIGTEGGGLSRLEKGRIRTYGRDEGLPNDVVLSITEDAGGTLWLATNGGLVRMTGERFIAYDSRAGDLGDSIFRILEDGAGHFWISANRGIFRVRRDDLDRFDTGALAEIPVAWYGEADGMRSSEANGGIQPAGWRAADGRLWFPTLAGVVSIDPTRIVRDSPPPRVLIEEVRVDGQARNIREPIAAAADARTLEIRYTAPEYQAPAQTRFRYRLAGYDEDWVDAGTRREARYTNLPPGRYRFEVMARRRDSGWSEPASLASLHFAPHFYETWIFYLLSGVVVSMAVFGVHRARIRTLETRERELSLHADELRQALDGQRASEKQFRDLFDNVFEGLYRTTPDGQVLLANRALAQMLGYASSEELRQVNPHDFYVRPSDRDRFQASLAREGEVHGFEVDIRRPDGRSITVLENARAVRDETGSVRYIEGTMVDITERKYLEDQNRQLQKMELVGRLASSIAHDFNNLLTPILGYSDELLEELPGGDSRRADVEEIRKAAESAASLTRQLLAFSRQQIVEPRVLDVNDVARALDRILRRLVGEHIEIRLDLDPAGAHIRADAGQIEQVLVNLVVNARDAMTLGGAVTIATSHAPLDAGAAAALNVAPGRYVVITVTDTGPGIPDEVMAHLFQPFFTTKRHGTGLGLSTVRDIVLRSGGAIGVDSARGRGASFRVYLPEVAAAATEASRSLTAAAAKRGTETVLVAEDNNALRELTRRVLERQGYTVLTAHDAVEAKDVAARHAGTIHLLLTDVVMPGASGPALAADLTARLPRLKVLYMTGYVDDESWPGGAQPPSAELLQKPFSSAVLAAKVRDVLADGTTAE
ncbi:MAG: two-component regulator propeller domain-containing protein [Vicinamibacterales bacterium]